MSGQTYLKKYRAERYLAEGGMSIVYLGRQLDLDREVVIKVMRPELASCPRHLAHFRREIHIASRFQHPCAVTFFDADAESRRPVLVMEHCRGADLRELIKKNPRFSVDRVGHSLGQLCEVLHAAHEAGIVHQDLKPSNVMILHPNSRVEKVKLMDFGLAKMSSLFYINENDLGNQLSPVAFGTPEYVSPEQARGNDVDRRSDVYTLGVMLYEMLTGQRPFNGKTPEDLLLAHVSDPPRTFARLGIPDAVPEEIEMLVLECLAKYPEERPATVEEVALRYEKALGRKIYSSTASNSRCNNRSTAGLSRSTMQRLARLENAPDRHAITCRVSATMPESMAMLKLKGFIHDVGGRVVSTTPGYVRVLLPMKKRKSGGLFGLFGAKSNGQTGIDLELRVETEDAGRPNELSISMFLRASEGRFDEVGRKCCDQLSRDLQAYLR